jgi:hypothetical protein
LLGVFAAAEIAVAVLLSFGVQCSTPLDREIFPL